MRFSTALAWMGLASLIAAPGVSAATSRDGEVDAYARAWLELGDFHGCLLVASGDGTPAPLCFGLADADHAVANRPETKFRIGSVSKQFTAAAVLLLEEDGRLSTEDPVSRHLPAFPEGDRITIHQLLTHTSGLADLYRLPGYETRALRPSDTADWVTEIGGQPLEFEPGSGFAYSNSGYLLLAHLIEVVSGRTYDGFLRQRIFAPLAMHDTGEADPRAILPNRARGYDPRGARGLENAPYQHPSAVRGAGSLYSTVPDLLRWSRSLRRATLLSRASIAKMLTAESDGYGYGIAIFERFGRPVAGHDGRLPGFTAGVDTFLDEDLSIVWAANLQTGIGDRLRHDLAAIALGEPYEMPPSDRPEPFPVGRETLRSLAGRYRFAPHLVVEVKEDSGRLLARANQSAFTELYPDSAEGFFNRATYSRASFEAPPGGSAATMIWRQEGSEFRGERLGGEDPFVERAREFVEIYERLGTFNGAVLVAKGGEVILREGFGMASYELGSPNAPETVFRVASLSKPLTAIAVGRLWEAGRLDLAQTLDEFVPEFPSGDRITVGQLLSHRSGVPHINDLPWYERESRFHHEIDQLIERFQGEPLAFAPGTDRAYSNGGYALLARIIERASGMTYGEYLDQEVLAPLGMSRTGHDRHDLLLAGRASGYLPGALPGRRSPAPYVEPSIKIGGGSLYSTVTDLYRLDRALRQDELLRRTTWDALFPDREEGLSLTGRAPGFYAVFRHLADEDLTVIVLSNNYALHNIDDGLVALASGREPETPAVVGTALADPGIWRPLTGSYRWPEPYGTEFRLRLSKSGHLQYEEVERDVVVGLFPGEGETFYHPLYDASCRFVREADRTPSGIECRSWWASEPVVLLPTP